MRGSHSSIRSLYRALASALLLGLLGFSISGAAQAQQNPASFPVWLEALRGEAISKGISPSILDQALTGITPIPRVIELDRSQPEFKQTFMQYLTKRVSQTRIDRGIKEFAANRALLEEVGQRYGVQPRFIVSLWGMETNYGSYMGKFSVIQSLATLAYDGRRSTFFRKELLNALQILDEGHIAPGDMEGSWAGAMGQSQFMPSSFLQLAVDYNGDGRRDIWGTKADVFASIANYLSRYKWNPGETWGRRVLLPQGFDRSLVGLKSKRDLSVWQSLGVRRLDGSSLPFVTIDASIVTPEKTDPSIAYLAYGNFDRIMKWNRSTYFAVAVGTLADKFR
ncbi:MAG: lytic murein transglycosylase [Pseudomonadota bacterium]